MRNIPKLIGNIKRENNASIVHAYDTNIPMHDRQVIFLEEKFHDNANRFIQTNHEHLKRLFASYGFEFFYLPSAILTREQRKYWDPTCDPKSAPITLQATMLYDFMEAKQISGNLPAIMIPYRKNEEYHELCGLTIDEDNPYDAFHTFFKLCGDPIWPGDTASIFTEHSDDPSDTSASACTAPMSSAPHCDETDRQKSGGLFKQFGRLFQKHHKIQESSPCPKKRLEVEESTFESPHIKDLDSENDYAGGAGGSAANLDLHTQKARVCPEEGMRLCLEEGVETYLEEDLPLTDEEQEMMLDIQRKLNLLRSHGLSEAILKKLFAPRVRPSRMIIRKDGTIVLPDYNHTVIDMIPLDKVLYLLLLRHPEGIYQKDLSDHVNEMKELYCRITGGFLPQRALAGIINLASPLSNSCNEKISRIRKVFQSHFQPAIADFYTVSGGRAEARRIPLQPDLIVWE